MINWYAVVRLCYHSYDYRPNWTPLSPITINLLIEFTSYLTTLSILIGSTPAHFAPFLLARDLVDVLLEFLKNYFCLLQHEKMPHLYKYHTIIPLGVNRNFGYLQIVLHARVLAQLS